MAEAPIQPLAWEPSYAAGVAQDIAKKDKKKKKKKKDFGIATSCGVGHRCGSDLALL